MLNDCIITFIMVLVCSKSISSLILNKNIYNKLSFKNAYSTTILKSSFSTINNQNIDDIDANVDYPEFDFKILLDKTDTNNNNNDNNVSKERLGILSCPHGIIETPNFIFCATKAAMKGVTPEMMKNENSQIILSNTYHLMLQPGSSVVRKAGGLHKFSGWNGPMLTDSGGYQIFSMGFGSVSSEIKSNRNTEALGWQKTLLKIDDNGALFKSYMDGSLHYLTPEESIRIQRDLGADFIVVLDECTPFNVDKEYTKESMRRSHRWAIRSMKEFLNIPLEQSDMLNKQALYGIIQGGIYSDLRDESIDFINNNPFFGVAIGGSLGSDKATMHSIVSYTRSRIKGNRPVHLLGIGGVRDIFHGVRCGIDTFDCVHPTRIGRHGSALVKKEFWEENVENVLNDLKEMEDSDEIRRNSHPYFNYGNTKINNSKNKNDSRMNRKNNRKKLPSLNLRVKEHIDLHNGRFKADDRPIDPTCNCYTCTNFSRSYLHHLFKAKETLGGTLVTVHNIHFMNRLMKDIREGIKTNTLDRVENDWVHPDLKAELSPDIIGNVVITENGAVKEKIN